MIAKRITKPTDVKNPHKEEHLRSSDFITDIVIGMSDGLTVPFALAAVLNTSRMFSGNYHK